MWERENFYQKPIPSQDFRPSAKIFPPTITAPLSEEELKKQEEEEKLQESKRRSALEKKVKTQTIVEKEKLNLKLEEAKNKSSKEKEAASKLKVLKFFPHSACSSNVIPSISVSFSHAIASLSQVEAFSSDKTYSLPWKIQISPPIEKGYWEITNPTTLTYLPLERTHFELPKSTEYTVEIPASATSLEKQFLGKSFVWKFSSPVMLIKSIYALDVFNCYPLETSKHKIV